MVFHGLIVSAAVVIILAGVKVASGIIAPTLLALFATIILLVPLRWLQSKGCPSFLSLIIVLGCVAVIFLSLSRLVASSLAELSKESRTYARRIEREFDRIEKWAEDQGYRLDFGIRKKMDEIQEKPENRGVPASGETPEKNGSAINENRVISPREVISSELAATKPDASASEAPLLPPSDAKTSKTATDPPTVETSNSDNVNLFDQARSAVASLMPPQGEEEPFFDDEELEPLQTPPHLRVPEPSLTDLNAQSLLNWFGLILNETRYLIGKSFLVMIITLFMIFEASRFPAKIDRAFGKGPITNEHLHHIASEIRRYLFLKAISSLMSAVAATVVYLFFDVPAALFWGLIAFFLYFIPNLGGIIASIVPGLLIFMQWGPLGVLVYAVCLVTIECTIGYGIEPKILGHGLGISTVMIILSLITWGWLLGAIGLFLAAPLTIMVKIILQAFKETEWIAVLIGDGSKRAG